MLESKRILLVDDSATIRSYLGWVLREQGALVDVAETGLEGLQKWREGHYEIVLLDLFLPDTDGIEVLSRIREADYRTCVVMITGMGAIKSAIEAVRKGADGYVEKSQIAIGGDLSEFLHHLERSLEIRAAQVARRELEDQLKRKNQELQATVEELQAARHSLIDERNKLRQILFSLSEMVIVVDRDGRVILINPLAEQELGMREEEVVGKPLTALDVSDVLLAEVDKVMHTGTSIQMEVEHIKRYSTNGSRVFSTTLNPVHTHDGKLLGTVIVLRDITQEQELQRMKEDFYSMITHDLRSPTSAILGFVDMLRMGTMGEVTSEQREILDIIYESGKRLLELINDFLDYSMIDSGFLRLHKENVDVRELIREAVRDVQPLARQKEHQINVSAPAEPVVAYIDGPRIKQVLINLLSNAVKYTDTGGSIEIVLDAGTEEFTVSVRDNGIGIPESQLPYLFTKYRRVPGERTRLIRGTGLGLLIVKEIVEAHGGRVWVQSKEGEGSTFGFTIPLATSDPNGGHLELTEVHVSA
ncbi:MAG TPA: hybrid sensor histidine kinase/response regulator [Anaerolineae bacterium]|nr:hybrid sensor histidine kinase/response regulator [Anaerolineae bacterium]